ncbi:uncharacterized protein LOC131430401 [Malaya genurostris]|uniref:uncharacterized protein LOC131430401 n=1 Tax=Malaya genurostris TaxID=325434 RepID=UPI0026F3AF29|nr:uncharacterized protein LOC131430401 [Malaya genurostris]
MRALAIVLLCLAVTWNYGSVEALRCIQCQSTNTTCETPILECNNGTADVSLELLKILKPDLATKEKGDKFRCFEVDVKKDENLVYIKGCIYDDVDVCTGETKEGAQEYCHRCTDDVCNGASALAINISLLLGLVLALRTYSKW